MRRGILLVVVCLSIFSAISATAQGVIVHKSDGTKIAVMSSELDSITAYAKWIDHEAGISLKQEVDLGLSVKWAGWNVGASSPEEYGGYYAWGETEEKSDYSEDSYKYLCDEDGDGVKEYVNIGNNISGTEYDVARQKWGGSWRMPTKEEFNELLSKCTWTWMTYKGINGYKVTGPNGDSIFLPAVGSFVYTTGAGIGDSGFYWSGTLYEGYSDHACAWYNIFYRGESILDFYYNRFSGFAVRPVK